MATGLERTAVDPMTGQAGAASSGQRRGVAATAADPMQELLRRSAEVPEYGQLVEYLSLRRQMPPIRFEPGRMGVFRVPGFYNDGTIPETGVIGVGMREGPNTVVHELTHAADRQIEKQYFDLLQKRGKLTPLEQQFMQTYEKLVKGRRGFFDRTNVNYDMRDVMAQRMNPQWAAEESKYRASSSELPAWAMGQMAEREPDSYNPPLHLDPTMATEFSILLDMAKRLQKTRPPEGR